MSAEGTAALLSARISLSHDADAAADVFERGTFASTDTGSSCVPAGQGQQPGTT
jgi:hypothetical protein